MRRRTRKRASCNTHELAIHIALPHQLATKTTPCVLLLTFFLGEREVGVTKLSMCMVVKGIGDYLSRIYLQTVEKNPGPMTEEERDAALSQISNILGKVQSIQTELETVKTTCDSMKTELIDMKQTFEHRFVKNEKAVNELKSESENTQRRLGQLERNARRKNIVIFGAPAEAPVADVLQTIFRDALGLQQDPEYEGAYRLGKQTAKPPILVKLRNQSDKADIMSKVRKLKGTKIVISDDLTPEEQAERRTIVAAAKVANAQNIPCRVRRTGLLVNDRLFTPAELCDPDWVKAIIQPMGNTRPQPPPPPQGGGGGGTIKRPFANTISPASAAAAALEDFRRPRSDSTDSLAEKAGGRPQRGLSKEDKQRPKKK
jgi:hypothetical protein